MIAKYDWIELKKEYLLGDYKSLKEFAASNNVNYDVLRRKAKTWTDEKVTRKSAKSHKIIKKVTEQEIKKEVDRNTKHLGAYDLALDACVSVLKDELNKGVDMYGNGYTSPVVIHSKLARIVESLEKIQKGQRLAEGLDNDSNSKTTGVLPELLEYLKHDKKSDL